MLSSVFNVIECYPMFTRSYRYKPLIISVVIDVINVIGIIRSKFLD